MAVVGEHRFEVQAQVRLECCHAEIIGQQESPRTAFGQALMQCRHRYGGAQPLTPMCRVRTNPVQYGAAFRILWAAPAGSRGDDVPTVMNSQLDALGTIGSIRRHLPREVRLSHGALEGSIHQPVPARCICRGKVSQPVPRGGNRGGQTLQMWTSHEQLGLFLGHDLSFIDTHLSRTDSAVDQ